jgi:MGT family glycosyltransferase
MSGTRKSFLMTVWEGGGNVPPVLAVARKLRDAGHDVRIMSDACNGPEISAAGAEFRPWVKAPSRPDKSPASDILKDWEPADPAEGLGRVIDRIMCGPAAAYAADTLAEIERARPDAVIANEMLLGTMAGAEAARIPFALLCPNISLAPVPGVPPMGPGLPPAQTAAEHVQYAQIAQGNAALFNRGLPLLNDARTALGLGALDHVYGQWENARAVLLATARAFDFAPEHVPEKFAYVGPQFHDPQTDESWTSPWPVGDRRPLVLVSFSTTHQAQEAALQRVIDAAAGLPLRLLVTLGPALDAAAFTVPENAKLVAHAPHRLAMREAAAVVSHGGHGTVMRALAGERPLLVMPMGRDQSDNAARVATRGAGLMLDPHRAHKEEIGAALTRLLTEPDFAKAASALGQAICAEARTTPIVDLLEAVCAGEACAANAAA